MDKRKACALIARQHFQVFLNVEVLVFDTRCLMFFTDRTGLFVTEHQILVACEQRPIYMAEELQAPIDNYARLFLRERCNIAECEKVVRAAQTIVKAIGANFRRTEQIYGIYS